MRTLEKHEEWSIRNIWYFSMFELLTGLERTLVYNYVIGTLGARVDEKLDCHKPFK